MTTRWMDLTTPHPGHRRTGQIPATTRARARRARHPLLRSAIGSALPRRPPSAVTLSSIIAAMSAIRTTVTV